MCFDYFLHWQSSGIVWGISLKFPRVFSQLQPPPQGVVPASKTTVVAPQAKPQGAQPAAKQTAAPQQAQPAPEPAKPLPEPNFDQLLDILLNLEAPLEARVGASTWLTQHAEKFRAYLQSNTDKDTLIAMMRLLSTTAAQIAGST